MSEWIVRMAQETQVRVKAETEDEAVATALRFTETGEVFQTEVLDAVEIGP